MAVVEQVAVALTAFTSQYGSENGISYTAGNLVGSPDIYPNYGDFTQACVFRTYGPWWKICPSGVKPIGRQQEDFISDDYTELMYNDKVKPTKIDIYETYNPGTVIKILVCDTECGTDVDSGLVHWVTLWEGPPQVTEPAARIFSPPLKDIQFYTNLIRLEFCHRLCDYYTELDSVMLTGFPESVMESLPTHDDYDCSFDNLVKNCCFSKNENVSDVEKALEDCSISDQSNQNSMLLSGDDFGGKFNLTTEPQNSANEVKFSDHTATINTENDVKVNTSPKRTDFLTLPEEVVQLILSYLDTTSLCRLAQSCKKLQSHCYDPLQFTEFSLKPYWSKVNDHALYSLSERLARCQKLDLSWCGNHGLLTATGFQKLVSVCGESLTCLRLANCDFVNSQITQIISRLCPSLEELDLQSCPSLVGSSFMCLSKLTCLRRLNLYRTQTDLLSMLQILRKCPRLEHLNLGSCIHLTSPNLVLDEIGKNCPKMKSLDLWRWKNIDEDGLEAIAKSCPNLEELDIGWVSSIRSSTGCYRVLAQSCRKLKKLVFTANRSVCDEDLFSIAQNCPDLQQLDILGTREVTLMSAKRILDECHKMKFFDVSFCHHISAEVVEKWKVEYPHVDIKRSFQS